MNNEIKTKNRIEYLDAMRGFCILLVVCGHLGLRTSVNNVVSILPYLPLFFFLSGFLCYSSFTPLSVNKFKRRTFGQLLPTIITGSIFIILMRNGDFEDALFDKSKAGYWFTLVAFEIYLLYAVFSYAVDHISQSLKVKVYVFVAIALLSLPLSYVTNKYGFSNAPFYRLFSLVSVVSYIPYFLFGVTCRMFNIRFKSFIENPWIQSVVILVFVCLHTISHIYSINIKLIFYGIPGVILVYMTFYNFREYFTSHNFIANSLSYIGKRTLPIYLLHYFLLPGVASNMILPAVYSHCGWLVLSVCLLLLTILVVSACIIVEAVFRKATPLYRLCFGYPI